MKRIIFLIAFCLSLSAIYAQTIDVIHLKNGFGARGTITNRTESQITLQSENGRTLTIDMSEIESMEQEHIVFNLQDLIFTVGNASFVMKPVEGGTFLMGSGESDDEPIRNTTLDSYYIGETEVTQALWLAVMGNNPSRFIGDNRPVEQVSWNDCQVFVQKINLLTGKRFRLPTEAEWEYAARGGKRSKGYKYAGSNIVDNVAVYEVNSKNMGEGSPDYGTHIVKSKQANELGLYDMSGNVWEWCNDYYNENFNDRVLRGGRWNASAYHCRVTRRIWDYPNSNYYGSGFRLVLDP